MSKRRYTKMEILLPVIESMLEAGMSHREIEDELGLEGDRPIHNLLKRQRHKAARGMPKLRGRKPASRQTVNLVLDTIRIAMKKEKKKVAAELQLHSDQGFQYTSHAYFKLTQSYGITPSMSRKGNPYDNAMAENFFSILKTECIYRYRPKTLKEADNGVLILLR